MFYLWALTRFSREIRVIFQIVESICIVGKESSEWIVNWVYNHKHDAKMRRDYDLSVMS